MHVNITNPITLFQQRYKR